MPTYRVWYRNNEEPLEFASAGRLDDGAILERVIEQEGIEPSAVTTVKELIAKNGLGPVKYTEDESEMNTIG
jgi:hypothetical protein